MVRWREDHGQTAAEYMGVLLVVAAIVLGLASSSDLGGRVAGEIERIVCEIAGRAGCGEAGGGRGAGRGRDGDRRDRDDRRPGSARRRVRDSGCNGKDDGKLVRDEGDGRSGNRDADSVYENLGRVDDYFASTFGRDSYNGRGATLVAWINYCEEPGKRWNNAKWDGERMLFGRGYAGSIDVVAHELTHALIDRTARLDNSCETGALNESLADIFASNIDPEDWKLGEDLRGGAARDMARPGKGRVKQPAHVRDYVKLPNERSSDRGGVHYNSGIPNHAYYLMVKRIGRAASEQIVYRALTKHLRSDSTFEDFRSASIRAARELYGSGSPEQRGVERSFAAVGLDGNWRAPRTRGC